MAPAPKKPCNRCKTSLTTGRYCPDCQAFIDAQAPLPENRASSSARGYNWTWHKIRNAKLARSPICERCQAAGLVIPAKTVHHKDRNPINNSPDNHESLCLKCHQEEHRLDRVMALRNSADYRRLRPGRWA